MLNAKVTMQSHERQLQIALRRRQRPPGRRKPGDSDSRLREVDETLHAHSGLLTPIESIAWEDEDEEVNCDGCSSSHDQAWGLIFPGNGPSTSPSPYNLLESYSGDPFSTLPSNLPQSFLGQHVQLCKLLLVLMPITDVM
jgi:hypothetical protein